MSYYYYRYYFSDHPKDDYIMHITEDGVSLEYRSGKVITTGLVPRKLFPKQEKLSPADIRSIHRFIKFSNYKLGKVFSKSVFDKIKKEYYSSRKNNP